MTASLVKLPPVFAKRPPLKPLPLALLRQLPIGAQVTDRLFPSDVAR